MIFNDKAVFAAIDSIRTDLDKLSKTVGVHTNQIDDLSNLKADKADHQKLASTVGLADAKLVDLSSRVSTMTEAFKTAARNADVVDLRIRLDETDAQLTLIKDKHDALANDVKVFKAVKAATAKAETKAPVLEPIAKATAPVKATVIPMVPAPVAKAPAKKASTKAK